MEVRKPPAISSVPVWVRSLSGSEGRVVVGSILSKREGWLYLGMVYGCATSIVVELQLLVRADRGGGQSLG